jgi:hypothetical protein
LLKIVLWVLGLWALGVAVFTIIPDIQNWRCKPRWKQSGLNAEAALGTGCMAQVDGRWIPESNVQIQPRRQQS